MNSSSLVFEVHWSQRTYDSVGITAGRQQRDRGSEKTLYYAVKGRNLELQWRPSRGWWYQNNETATMENCIERVKQVWYIQFGAYISGFDVVLIHVFSLTNNSLLE